MVEPVGSLNVSFVQKAEQLDVVPAGQSAFEAPLVQFDNAVSVGLVGVQVPGAGFEEEGVAITLPEAYAGLKLRPVQPGLVMLGMQLEDDGEHN
jgi:hypothetical protein